MKKNLNEILKEILLKDTRFVSNTGELLKNSIREQAEKLDENLINSLLENDKTREIFFKPIKNVIVFDSKKFIQFINNKEFLPDSRTSFKNKIGLTDNNGNYLSNSDEIVLSWPYKDGILAGGQDKEDSKREEIFYNEILGYDEIDRLLDEKVWTNFKKIGFDVKTKQCFVSTKFDGFKRDENGIIKDNLIIKGNNLLALHSLKSNFANKVKLIYIDPPYNTGNDSFGYNDKFNHSTWLTFMKNRLEIARELLRDDGVIFVQCDDNEQAYLKVLMDEIFGRENFICNNIIKVGSPNGFKIYGNKPVKLKENILIYCKNNISYKYNRVYVRTYGNWDTHFANFYDRINEKVLNLKEVLVKNNIINEKQKISELNINNEKFKEFYIKNKDNIFQTGFYKDSLEKLVSLEEVNRNKIYRKNDDMLLYNGRHISFLSQSLHMINGNYEFAKALGDFWDDINFNNVQNEAGNNFKQGKKPESLIERIIEISTIPGDIVLDYHLGSGTTCAVAHKMGRQYIGIEQMDYIENITIERMKKVIEGEQGGISKNINWQGGGEFVYMEIMKSNQIFIDKIVNCDCKDTLQCIFTEIKESGFINYYVNINKFEKNIGEFECLSLKNQKLFLLELLDKNMLYVNYSEIDDEKYKVSDEDKKINSEFYKF